MFNPPPPPGTLQSYIYLLPYFLTNYVIPFLLGLAFLIFVVNAVRYFVIGGANEESQEKARALALYSIAAFVAIFIFWGVVTLVTYSLDFWGFQAPCPDYFMGSPSSPCNVAPIPQPTNGPSGAGYLY